MGEAKKNIEQMRANFIKMMERWMFEPTEWEAQMVAEIFELQAYEVERLPADILAYMKMKPQECHANCAFMEREDPDQLIKHVVGWSFIDNNFVLHSVILQHGKLTCVTPAPDHIKGPITFIPDEKLSWKDEGNGLRTWHRAGRQIGPGLRGFVA